MAVQWLAEGGLGGGSDAEVLVAGAAVAVRFLHREEVNGDWVPVQYSQRE